MRELNLVTQKPVVIKKKINMTELVVSDLVK